MLFKIIQSVGSENANIDVELILNTTVSAETLNIYSIYIHNLNDVIFMISKKKLLIVSQFMMVDRSLVF